MTDARQCCEISREISNNKTKEGCVKRSVLDKIWVKSSVFTISAPSYRDSETLPRCAAHILAVLIVFSRCVVEEKKKKRAKLSIARCNFNCLLIINRRPVYHTARATRTNPSLFLSQVEGRKNCSLEITRRDGATETLREMRTRVKRGADWLGPPAAISGPCVSATCSTRMLPLRPPAVRPRKDHLHPSHWPAYNWRETGRSRKSAFFFIRFLVHHKMGEVSEHIASIVCAC